MVDNEGFWAKTTHIWGPIQAVSGVYCAALATWEHLYPHSSNGSGQGWVGGMSISRYLWIGIIVLGLSVAIPAILKLIRKWRSSPKTEVHQHSASRLKILSAYYGVDGGPDDDVADKYLRPRILGNALAGWVGSGLFGALDPAVGTYKRLKVRYSFDGREAIIERRENEL